MAKDERLFLQITIDMHRHPKIQRLPIEVRWAFIEMLCEARIADNDGVFDADEAEFLWSRETLEALLKSHPSKPLLMANDGKYAIRDYAKHQVTKSSRDELSAKRSEAGKAGAAARWGQKDADFANSNGMASAKQVPGKRSQAIAESESESESELERPITTHLVGLSSNAREAQTDSEEDPEEVEAMLRLAATQKLDLNRISSQLDEVCGRTLNHATTYRFAMHVISKAKAHVQNRQGYVMKAITNDPFEAQQWIDREGTV